MKHLFFDEWKRKRLSKIVDIFGKSWFKEKQILELGCAHGDIGIELLKLGSNVVFTDVREELFKELYEKVSEYSYNPECHVIDQNEEYDLGKKFDLVIHTGVLYNLENWKNDLKCALSHTNTMILETTVSTKEDYKTDMYINNYIYGPYSNCVNTFTQESVERELCNLGCKFIRMDNTELNCSGWLYNNSYIEHVYDWNNEFRQKNNKHNIHYRRMWLVLK